MADIFVISQISEKFSKKFQKFNFSAVFKNFLIFFFDLGQLDIAFMVCIKEWEYNTPKCAFSWGGEFHPPPQHSGNRYAVGNRVKWLAKYTAVENTKKICIHHINLLQKPHFLFQISRLPKIVQNCFCIQNLPMDLSFLEKETAYKSVTQFTSYSNSRDTGEFRSYF